MVEIKLRRRPAPKEGDRRRARLMLTVIQAVLLVEDLLGPGDGAKKKTTVVELLNKRIDLPVLGENVEAVLIGELVDVAVSLLNLTGWPDVLGQLIATADVFLPRTHYARGADDED